MGIFAIEDAIELAKTKGMDVVEVSPNTEPPVCRFLDYGKFLFEQKRKRKDLKRNKKQYKLKKLNLDH